MPKADRRRADSPCRVCGGSGRVVYCAIFNGARKPSEVAHPAAPGSGVPCSWCRGTGRVAREEVRRAD